MDNPRAVAAVGLLLALPGCIYGFHGGGLPSDVKTMAILPFDNETPEPGLEEQLLAAMRKSLDSRLGVRDASEDKADAVVSGSITRYDVDIPIGYSASTGGAPVTGTRRKLEVSVDVQIVDEKTGKTLFERKGLVADGEYAERAESDGLRQAIGKLVDDMVEGAQSQW
jgi:curli biogenesis system outer membrane secretion channel CsgG